MKLRKCLWLRIHCDRCGDYDLAIVPRPRLPETCVRCSLLIEVTQSAWGQTTRELPWSSLENAPRKLWQRASDGKPRGTQARVRAQAARA